MEFVGWLFRDGSPHPVPVTAEDAGRTVDGPAHLVGWERREAGWESVTVVVPAGESVSLDPLPSAA